MSRRWFNKAARRGTALLEAALCAAVLAPLAVTGIQYAYAMYRLEEIHVAVQDAARWAATAPAAGSDSEFAERVRRVAAYAGGDGKTLRVRGAEPRNYRVELRKDGGRVVAVRVAAQGIKLEWPGGGKVLENTPAAEMPRAR